MANASERTMAQPKRGSVSTSRNKSRPTKSASDHEPRYTVHWWKEKYSCSSRTGISRNANSAISGRSSDSLKCRTASRRDRLRASLESCVVPVERASTAMSWFFAEKDPDGPIRPVRPIRSGRNGLGRHHGLVAREIVLELAAADAPDDRVPLVLGLLQDVLPRQLTYVGFRKIFAQCVLEFEVTCQIDRRCNDLEISFDSFDAFWRIGFQNWLRLHVLLGPGVIECVDRIGDDRDAVLAGAKPQRQVSGLRFPRRVLIDQDRGERRRNRPVDHLARELGARHKTEIELIHGFRLLRVGNGLARSIPILAAHHVSLRDARNHLRRAPVRRFGMVHLLVLEIEVDGVLAGRRVERRLLCRRQRESRRRYKRSCTTRSGRSRGCASCRTRR